ncbi:MAG: MBG domain-containing protein, partial [Actinomycetota bacterium]
PRPIEVTADDVDKVAGDPDPVLGFAITDGELVDSDTLNGSLERLEGQLIGEYAITQGTIDNVNNPNYLITFVPGVFTIEGDIQDGLELAVDDESIRWGESTELSVTGGSGDGEISYSIQSESSEGTCSIETDDENESVRLVGNHPGSCTVYAEKDTDGTYAAAESNVISVVVTKHSQTIEFPSPGDQLFSLVPFSIDPTSDSGQEVEVVSTSSSICAVTDSGIEFLFGGMCELVAQVAESANYFAAERVTVQFTVEPVVPFAPALDDVAVDGNNLIVTFTPGSHGGNAITGYEYSLDGGVTWESFPAGSVASPLMIPEVESGPTFDVAIRAINGEGAGESSNAVSVTTESRSGGGGSGSTNPSVPATTPTNTSIPDSSVATTTPTATTMPTATTTPPSTTASTVASSIESQPPASAVAPGSSSPATSAASQEPTPGTETPVPSAPAPQATGEMTAGESVVLRDGQQTNLTWSPLVGGGATASWGSVRVDIVPTSADGSTDPLLAGGLIGVEAGTTVEVSVKGLASESEVMVWLFSDPVFLGEARTDQAGFMIAEFHLPSSIEMGGHTIKLQVIEADGTATELAVGIVVLDRESASLNRAGELDQDMVSMLTAPTIIRFVSLSHQDSTLLIVLLIVLLVLFVSVGRFGHVKRSRVTPDFVSAIVDDATWTHRFGRLRWITPTLGFVLGAWSSVSTHALPLTPSVGIMALALVLSAIDPLAGAATAASFMVAVTVGGGVDSMNSIRDGCAVRAEASWRRPLDCSCSPSSFCRRGS